MKLVSWNIQWGCGTDGRVDLQRIVAHARRLADFDVLCLQEVSSGHDRLAGNDGSDQFEQLAALLPGFEAVVGIAADLPHPAGGRRRFGNMIFSRLPVRQVFRHLLPWPADDGTMSMQRLALEATVVAPSGPLRVLTTHLEYYSARQRAVQVERLRELQREAVAQARSARPGAAGDGPFEAVARGGPAILTGDFNFRPTDAEHARMQASIDAATPAWRDAWTIAHPGTPHAPTVGVHDKTQWPEPAFTFDFVFVGADLVDRVRGLRVDPLSDASDHQPVLLELD